ncbi:sulfur oxidation c-type cytochrome SoxX [Methyloprofundus sedimenti]|uniref:Sulfur oxidation c-type cytochrome SoxX n=1 Tax=Methyloprofundus sedimenti TaxID=1420851 RepID=A0A1V8M750_9GAMM|nr:sulfur oxidation c-type cytochrome SoxX [Methyloprofundus sedimenti]OQK17401.1 sulfur oxidation c-type cytochrome SoxX [Methyloprofundus sedimenti]
MKVLIFLFLSLFLSACACSGMKQRLATGKDLSFQRSKGNCLACHIIEDGEDPGNIGPPLIDIQTKYKTKDQLKAVIWDATQFNTNSSMPPFGKNNILSPEELDLVVDYIWSLNTPVNPGHTNP